MGCRVRGMSTQEYRASYNYREEYFKKNPGLFGCIWFCSQCFRPLIGKHNVVVDHIRPLNKGGLNHVSNCTACCPKCNSSKSDIVDGRMYKGYVFKFFESNLFRANRGIGAAAGLGVGLAAATASAGVRAGTKVGKYATKSGGHIIGRLLKLGVGAISFPLRKGSFLSRLAFLGVYALLIFYFLSSKTSILDAWLA